MRHTLIVILLIIPFCLKAEEMNELLKKITGSVVRVQSGPNTFSTGFFWKNKSIIVTTYHSITDEARLSFRPYGTHSSWYKVMSILAKDSLHDLVLLRVDTSKYATPYFFSYSSTKTPRPICKALTFGYPADGNNAISKDLTIGLSEKKTLISLFPEIKLLKSRPELKYLDVNTLVNYIDGQLVEGFSGAPIVDLEGNLIGIGHGGLDGGRTGICWCLDVRYLLKYKDKIQPSGGGQSSVPKNTSSEPASSSLTPGFSR